MEVNLMSIANRAWSVLLLFVFLAFISPTRAASQGMSAIRVSEDGRNFVHAGSGRPFVAWGFNYDHDEKGRLLEDYWAAEWPKVEEDFREMKELGANVVRVHLQVGKFIIHLENLGLLIAHRNFQLRNMHKQSGACRHPDAFSQTIVRHPHHHVHLQA